MSKWLGSNRRRSAAKYLIRYFLHVKQSRFLDWFTAYILYLHRKCDRLHFHLLNTAETQQEISWIDGAIYQWLVEGFQCFFFWIISICMHHQSPQHHFIESLSGSLIFLMFLFLLIKVSFRTSYFLFLAFVNLLLPFSRPFYVTIAKLKIP